VRLYEEGLIYPASAWSTGPVLHTAVSDLEVVSEEEAGHLWHLRYRSPERKSIWWSPHPPETCSRHRGGGTSRGRTLPAPHRPPGRVAAHRPQDPVIADVYVDKEFGSAA